MGLHVMFTKTERHREKAQTGSLGILLKRNILKKCFTSDFQAQQECVRCVAIISGNEDDGEQNAKILQLHDRLKTEVCQHHCVHCEKCISNHADDSGGGGLLNRRTGLFKNVWQL